jgi:hypothetical protein
VNDLFEVQKEEFSKDDPMNEWKGMPEFVQEKKEPFSKIIIRFDTEDDLIDFSELIGQKLTPKTKSIWHPFKSHWGAEKKVYKYEP